jgi:predicted GIY-YIG superfamily endonuclease
MAHWVYVLRCGDGSLYTGYTTDVDRRLADHAAGRGARYTRGRGPHAVIATWEYADRRSALQAEYRFKRLPRSEKLHWVTAVNPATRP